MFNENCPEETQGNILAILEVEQSSFEEKYLGLPTPDGHMKVSRFQSLKEIFRKRLTDWSEKYASMGVKEALIKYVAQALTVYVMRVFKLPDGFHEDYTKMIRNFW
jgi:hypothetical protein